jgi:hypothetical protein
MEICIIRNKDARRDICIDNRSLYGLKRGIFTIELKIPSLL